MKKLLLALLLVTYYLNSYATNSPSDKNDSIVINKFFFEAWKSIFVEPHYDFISEKFDDNKIFLKVNSTENQINSAIDTLEKNATISIDKVTHGKEFAYDVNLKSLFPSTFKEENIVDIAKIEVVECNLFNSKGKKLELKNFGSQNFGRNPEYDSNGKMKLGNTYAKRQIRFLNANEVDSGVNGSMSYKIKFITDYQKFKLNKNDTSKIIRIDSINYKIVKVFYNKVVLERIISDNCNSTDIKLISLDSNGNILNRNPKPIKKDLSSLGPNYFMYRAQNGLTAIPKTAFEFIQNIPSISFEDFMKFISDKKNVCTEQYLVLQTYGRITDEFIIYSPIYGIERKFEVKYKNQH
jgi:hypothetical protein